MMEFPEGVMVEKKDPSFTGGPDNGRLPDLQYDMGFQDGARPIPKLLLELSNYRELVARMVQPDPPGGNDLLRWQYDAERLLRVSEDLHKGE